MWVIVEQYWLVYICVLKMHSQFYYMLSLTSVSFIALTPNRDAIYNFNIHSLKRMSRWRDQHIFKIS